MANKNLGGRPTKLTEETVNLAELYVSDCEQGLKEITVRQGLDKEGDTRWQQTAPRLPNIARLAINCRIAKSTLHEWMKPSAGDDEKKANLRKRFTDAYVHIGNLQEACLVEEGGAGRLNPAVVNRILAAKHNYRDKTDVTSNDNELKATLNLITNPTISKKIQELDDEIAKEMRENV